VVIPGASSVAQLESNVAAAELELTAAQQADLTAAAREFQPQSAGRTLVDEVRSRFDDVRSRLGV
jgi:diketogulonate reductase-like aldo/keto reductase